MQGQAIDFTELRKSIWKMPDKGFIYFRIPCVVCLGTF